MLKRKLYYLLTPRFRLLIRRIYFFPIDLFDKVKGKQDILTPPRGLVFVGSGDFKRVGEFLFNQVKEFCEVKPESRILDVGSGIGRLAVPFTSYLNAKGSYEGFDIVKLGIDWCVKHIQSKFPNFNFIHIDLRNDLYNHETSNQAKNFVFPYLDDEFDLIIVTSVFTHMMPEDIDNYLKQINRVLKREGKCFATFFLLNQDIKKKIKTRNHFNFPCHFENYSLLDKRVKEANVAYEEDYLFNTLFPQNNLKVDTMRYGWWSSDCKEDSLNFQDIIILSKTD